MNFESLEAAVVPFPFTDRRAVKRWLALIALSATFNRGRGHLILTMITSVGVTGRAM